MLNPKDTEGKVVLGTYDFNPKISRKKLAHIIILHEYPISMVDHEGFREYSNSLQPLFKVVTRNTIQSDIFKIFEDEKKKTMKSFECNKSRIVITSDMWIANNRERRYMTLTAHYIDDSWTLKSQIIRYIYAFVYSFLRTIISLYNSCSPCNL
ncbi:Ribonuclease H-like domain containing protein [Parasponia andersonii]|uniref:Ribonuclease H-like domain containing protein n=1 Tax=Parasponia andersonii TaxID=3476 RepID=A0A2P5BLT3_PARAD|nr:Ribonuclease H-like domain containing protein [Parasponia andersonii]